MENTAQNILEHILNFLEGLFNSMGFSEQYNAFVNFVTSFADFF